MKNFLKRVFPNLMPQNQTAKLSDYDNISALPRIECDPSALGLFSHSEINQIFNNGQINIDWHDDEMRLNALAIPEMSGGVNPGDQRALYHLVRHFRPTSILEIGTHIGVMQVIAVSP